MPNEFLQSMKDFAVFLQTENRQVEEKIKEQKINLSAQRIAQAFDELGPETTPGQLRKLTFDLIQDAAGLNALQQNSSLISSLYSDSLRFLEKEKKDKEENILRGYLKGKGYDVPANIKPEDVLQIAQVDKSLETTVNVTNKDKTVTQKVYGKDGKVKKEEVINFRTADDDFRDAVRLSTVQAEIGLNKQIEFAKAKQEIEKLSNTFDGDTLRTLQISSIAAHKEAYKETLSNAQTLLNFINSNKDAKKLLDKAQLGAKTKGKKVGNALEIFKALDDTDKNKIASVLSDKEKTEYSGYLEKYKTSAGYSDMTWNELQSVNNQINYASQLMFNNLKQEDVIKSYDDIVGNLNSSEILATSGNERRLEMVNLLKQTKLGNALAKKNTMSYVEWQDWYKNLSDADKTRIARNLIQIKKGN